jgi:hypothetical protein
MKNACFESQEEVIINSYLVAHFAMRCRTKLAKRENVFMNLNSHDVICFINSKTRKILITKKDSPLAPHGDINFQLMTVLFTNEMCI